jgi:phage pi2 protein 07
MKNNYKLGKMLGGGWHYRGRCVYGRNRAWILYNEDGYIAWTFKTLKEFTGFIDKNFKRLSKSS